MDYDQFITEIQKYWDMRKKGLKKQANSFLFAFTKQFQENVPETEADAIRKRCGCMSGSSLILCGGDSIIFRSSAA